jgi:hypothetical protein
MGYMNFVTRRRYCPVIDTYADPERQEAYEKSKLDPKQVVKRKFRKK